MKKIVLIVVVLAMIVGSFYLGRSGFSFPMPGAKGLQCSVAVDSSGAASIKIDEASRRMFQTIEVNVGLSYDRLIVRDGMVYMWKDRSNKGTKSEFTDAEFYNTTSLVKNRKEYGCRPWYVDSDAFDVPSSVEFSKVASSADKGADAAIKANLANIRASAEISYDSEGSYDRVCGSNGKPQDDTIGRALAYVKDTMKSSVACLSQGKPASAWAISAALRSDPNAYWCVDSTGASKQVGAQISSAACAGK